MPQTTVSSKTEPLPVSLSEAKAHLRLAGGELDSSVQLALESAVAYVEDRCSRSFRLTETLTQTTGTWPDNPVRFDRQPVKAITSVTYYDADNASQTVASSEYRLITSTRGATVLEFDIDFTKPTHYSRGDAVTITYTAGYAVLEGNRLDVPPQIKWAILVWLEATWGDSKPNEQMAAKRTVANLISTVKWGAYR